MGIRDSLNTVTCFSTMKQLKNIPSTLSQGYQHLECYAAACFAYEAARSSETLVNVYSNPTLHVLDSVGAGVQVFTHWTFHLRTSQYPSNIRTQYRRITNWTHEDGMKELTEYLYLNQRGAIIFAGWLYYQLRFVFTWPHIFIDVNWECSVHICNMYRHDIQGTLLMRV
jgi:hypothetical protein